MKDAAKRFIQLVKIQAPKEDIEPYFTYFNDIPKVNEQVIKVLKLRILDKKTYKQIGEVFGFSGTRAHQLYAKGMYFIEEAGQQHA